MFQVPAPNHTQTPNILFDDWLPKLSHVELKVLMVIMRKTFGWHKIRDRISLSQLEKFTGSTRTAIIKAAKNLENYGLILRTKIGKNGTEETYYELVVIEDSNNFDQSSGETPPSLLGRPTKETITKEKKKETPNPLKGEPVCFGPFVKLREEEREALSKQFGESTLKEIIEEINDYLSSTGKKPYKDYAATIRNWMRRRKQNPSQKSAPEQKGIAPDADHRSIGRAVQEIFSTHIKQNKINVSSQYVEFNHENGDFVRLEYMAWEFKEQLIKNLRKMKLDPNTIKDL